MRVLAQPLTYTSVTTMPAISPESAMQTDETNKKKINIVGKLSKPVVGAAAVMLYNRYGRSPYGLELFSKGNLIDGGVMFGAMLASDMFSQQQDLTSLKEKFMGKESVGKYVYDGLLTAGVYAGVNVFLNGSSELKSDLAIGFATDVGASIVEPVVSKRFLEIM